MLYMKTKNHIHVYHKLGSYIQEDDVTTLLASIDNILIPILMNYILNDHYHYPNLNGLMLILF